MATDPTANPEQPKRKRGGQPGNRNAVSHGRWSRLAAEHKRRREANGDAWVRLLRPPNVYPPFAED